MTRILQKAFHLSQRIVRETKAYIGRRRTFGRKVANAAFVDGLIPPGKSQKYIGTISEYVDSFLKDLIDQYQNEPVKAEYSDVKQFDKVPVWCCWWQGEESMPELVKMCHARLKQVIPSDKADLHLITLDNYKEYVDIPAHVLDKFNKGIITMTTMSDVLRFHLLDKYGGYWLDATVFFTGDIPEQYFSEEFYCQKMVGNVAVAKREACGSRWCGFSMAGPSGSIIFRFMKDAFSEWWKHYDTIIDYVLIDYLLLSGYKHVPAIREIIDTVSDNNEDIFEMYKHMNDAYTPELLSSLTRRNVMHKLTYKEDLCEVTEDGKQTLYGYLRTMVYGDKGVMNHE